MKRLTINQIARANLKQNRRAYLSMAIGIFMAVFLAASLCLSVQCVVARLQENRAEQFGQADIYTINNNTMSDAEMLETGYFQPEIGHVYLTAQVPDTNVGIGYYDEIAMPLMHRRVLEGRMPEAPGEIALEKSVLDRLRADDMVVGDTLTLTLTPTYGWPEERSYTIVGFLNEQSSNLNRYRSDVHNQLWPAILTCAQEPGFSTGNVVIHRLFMLRPFVSLYQVLSAFEYGGEYGMQSASAVLDTWWGPELDNTAYFASPAYQVRFIARSLVVQLICTLGAALLIAVCAGISGAMESQLARKTEEIGMLRAVGATRRQIRRIFGRESWLLALTVSPLAILASLAFVWFLSLMAPSYVLFRPSLWVLLPVLLLVTVTILVSSSLPLRRASRIMPMSVLRDTAILRKARRIKPRKRFKVPALVARRQLTLHPTRLFGSVLLVAAMLVIAFIGVNAASDDWSDLMEGYPAFEIHSDSYRIHVYDVAFIDNIPAQMVLSSDLQQITTLPTVSKVLPHRELQVCFEADALSDYYSYPNGYGFGELNRHLGNEEVRAYYDEQAEASRQMAEEMGFGWNGVTNEKAQMDHLAAQKALGTNKPLVNIKLFVLKNDLKDMIPLVTEGRIDADAINAGREVILYAPDYYEYPGDDPELGDYTEVYNEYMGDNYLEHITNDIMTAGMVLPLAQFYDSDSIKFYNTYETQAEYDELYQSVNLRRATVTIGALIGGNDLFKLYDTPFHTCLITTEEGLRNMGLNYEYLTSASIYLSGVPDEATEQWLENRITSIASRGGMSVTNFLSSRRETMAQRQAVIMVLASVAVVFFAAAAGLICGNVSRQIRADSRMIGTLRAVGADDRALAACYRGSILISISLGTAVALVVYTIMALRGLLGVPETLNHTALVLSCFTIAAMLAGCCLGVLHLRVKDVIKKSIVENIKEL